jgi:hypothetical protein
MNSSVRPFIIILFNLIFCIVNSVVISAQSNSANFISENLPKLKQVSIDLNQNVLALLAIIKEYEKNKPVTSRVARIIKPFSQVKETDNINSLTIVEVRQNEEFLVIEERDKWYKIRTQDNREGWISDEEIQVINKQSPVINNNIKSSSNQETSVLLEQMARYKDNIKELYISAGIIIKKTEEEYANSSNDIKKGIEYEYKFFSGYKEKIEKYNTYAMKFIKPYEDLLIVTKGSKSLKLPSGERFKGTVSADVGRSSYKNMNSNSATSSRLGLNGIYQIDQSARANIGFNHQTELIQTAFANNNIEAGLAKQFSDKFDLNSNLGYNKYTDKAINKNSFGLFNASINTVYKPSNNANLYGNVNFQSKNFITSGDENYNGINYVFGTNLLSGSRNNIRFQIQGNNQSSEKDYLNFHQIRPQFNYTLRNSPEKSFNFGLEYDNLSFAKSNDFNDYQKYRADFRWRKSLKDNIESRNLNLTYKQFPKNPKQDYIKLESAVEKRSGSYTNNTTLINSFSYLLTYITQRENNFLRDYLDIRWDRSYIRPKFYSTTNIYSRLWNNLKERVDDSIPVPDHFIDFYGELGPSFQNNSEGTVKITSLKVGIVYGGHLFFNFDSDYLARNGNSIRYGLSTNCDLKIYKATLILAGSYERSIILVKETSYDPLGGNIVYGDILYRKPSSFQFNIDFRQSLSNSWDIHFNLSTYNINTDATSETSINPVVKKSNLRFSGGLIYRFAL